MVENDDMDTHLHMNKFIYRIMCKGSGAIFNVGNVWGWGCKTGCGFNFLT